MFIAENAEIQIKSDQIIDRMKEPYVYRPGLKPNTVANPFKFPWKDFGFLRTCGSMDEFILRCFVSCVVLNSLFESVLFKPKIDTQHSPGTRLVAHDNVSKNTKGVSIIFLLFL